MMTFITENANYCYKVMPFKLKNTRATYQRLMNTVFTDQIGRIMEVYVDDMVAKTMKEEIIAKTYGKSFPKLGNSTCA